MEDNAASEPDSMTPERTNGELERGSPGRYQGLGCALLTGMLLGVATLPLEAQDTPFVTVWNSTLPGASDDDQILIPGTGTYLVEWGLVDLMEYTDDQLCADECEITFEENGLYRVRMTDVEDFAGIHFSDLFAEDDAEKLVEIEQWGDVEWQTMESAFYGASNLDVSAADAPDLSNVTSMAAMFSDASSLDADLDHWDTGNVTNMRNVFRRAGSFNGDISSWETAQVTTIQGMFLLASSFDGDIGGWDVGNVTNMNQTFSGATSFNQDIGDWDVGNVTQFYETFLNAASFNQDIGNWDVGSVTDDGLAFVSMFRGASSFDQNLGDWEINTTGLGVMFDDSGLAVENYDATLSGWAEAQDIEPDVTLGAEGLQYCVAEDHRQTLIDDFGWSITDDGAWCVPDAIALESPGDGAVDVPIRPELAWEADQRAETYRLVVSENADLSSPVVDQSELTEPSFEPEEELQREADHYWRVMGSGDEDGPWSETRLFTTVAGAEALVAVSGENQSATVTSSLDDPFVVRAVDANDDPVEGHAIGFSFAEVPEGGEGHEISTSVQSTNAQGEAETLLTLGTAAGTYVVEADADGDLEGAPLAFAAEAEAGDAVAVESASGDGQTGTTGEPLDEPFIARVIDEHENPIEGHTIGFSVTDAPDGPSDYELSEGLVDTDAAGEAASTLNLGSAAGTYTVDAEAAGELDGSPVTFTAQAAEESDPDLGPVVVEASDPDPEAGDTVEVTVSVENEGDGSASDVTIPLALPDHRLEVEEAEASHGSFDEGEGVWEIDELGAGETATLTLDAVVQVPEPEEGS